MASKDQNDKVSKGFNVCRSEIGERTESGGAEDVYQSCGDDVEGAGDDESTHLIAKVQVPEEKQDSEFQISIQPESSGETSQAGATSAGINKHSMSSPPEQAHYSDLMPEEQLDSDNSDTAGLYEVNSRDAEEDQNQGYQAGRLASSSSDSIDDTSDDSDVGMPRWRGSLSTSSASPDDTDSSMSDDDGDSSAKKPKIDLSQVKNNSSLFAHVQSRMFGDYGSHKHHTCYTQRLMSNLNFVRRLKVVKKLDGHDGCVNALNFNESGNWLASGSDDTKVVIWDLSTHRPYLKFKTGHAENVFQCKFMPHSNDSQIVTCARDGMVRLAELSVTGSCRGTKKLAKHERGSHKLAIEKDAQHCLLSAGEDGLVYQIDLRKRKPDKIVATKQDRRHIPLYSIDKNPSNPYEFLTTGKEHFIRVYDKRKISEGIFMPEMKKLVPQLFSDEDSRIRDVTCGVYNYDGTEILASYNDDDIYLFDNSTSNVTDCVKTYKGHRNSQTVKGVNFYGPHSEYVVSGSDCGHVFLWDKQSEQIVQLQKADVGGVVNVLEPHPHFPFLAVSGLDHDIKLLMPNGEKLIDMKRHCKSINRNIRQRSNSSSRHPEEVDGHLFWTIMRHLESRRRRANQDAAEDLLDGDEADDDSMDTDSDSDEESGGRRTLSNVGCVTS